MSTLRRFRLIGPFAALYMVGFGALAASRGNSEFIFYGAVMVGLIVLVAAADRRVRFSHLTLWGLALWGFAHMAGGNAPLWAGAPRPEGSTPVLYSLWIVEGRLKYDQLVHVFGFFMATLVCWEVIRRRLTNAASPTFGVLLIVCCAGMGLGALNEIVEFAATRLLEETNVGGYVNTGWDLVANAVGALSATMLIAVRPVRRPA